MGHPACTPLDGDGGVGEISVCSPTYSGVGSSENPGRMSSQLSLNLPPLGLCIWPHFVQLQNGMKMDTGLGNEPTSGPKS